MTPKPIASPLAVVLLFAASVAPLTLLSAPQVPLSPSIVVIAVTPDAVIVGQDDDPRRAPEIKTLSAPKDGEETRFLESGAQPNPCWCYVVGDQEMFNAIKARLLRQAASVSSTKPEGFPGRDSRSGSVGREFH